MTRRLLVVALAVVPRGGRGGVRRRRRRRAGRAALHRDPTPPPRALDRRRCRRPSALDLEPLYGEALGGRRHAAHRPRRHHRPQRRRLRGVADGHAPGALRGADRRPHACEEYIDGILDVALVFSDIYDRWPGLETYDVCQEPADPDGTQGPSPSRSPRSSSPGPSPTPSTGTRVTVEDLVRGSQADPPAARAAGQRGDGRRPRLRRPRRATTAPTTRPATSGAAASRRRPRRCAGRSP